MPVYLFTFHAHGSWMPDRQQGFVQKGRGIQKPSAGLARSYRKAAKHPPFQFDRAVQEFLIEVTQDVCRRRGWRLHGAATDPTHVHLLVDWRSQARWQDVRGNLRNSMSTELSKRAGQFGRPWFVKDSSRRRVKDREHFEYLVIEYLPGHKGVRWFEDRGWIQEARRARSRPDSYGAGPSCRSKRTVAPTGRWGF